MTFNLRIPTPIGPLDLQLASGEMLFVLGANGSGKSSLMLAFAQQHGNARKIAAHRQTWIHSDTLDITPSSKQSTEKSIRSADRNSESRYRDAHGNQRAMVILYDLIEAASHLDKSIADAARCDDFALVTQRAKTPTVFATLNNLLRESNIPIHIEVTEGRRVVARKNESGPYGVRELSDGERNALLIAGEVLTARKDSLLIIDEPERHLHRSIISPLLGQLLRQRKDCTFVISTHDHTLPLEYPEARIILLRSFGFREAQWEADQLSPGTPIDDGLKRDLLGARQRVLFVEGTETSLDKRLYSIVFPMVSVIPRGSRRDVEQVVRATRAAEGLQWLRAFGIVDSDGLDAAAITAKRSDGVYAVPYYSVEAIYYHPWIIERFSTEVLGDSNKARAAIDAGIRAVAGHTQHLSQKAAKAANRQFIMQQIPNDDDLLLLGDKQLTIINNSGAIHERRRRELESAVTAGNWEKVLTACPIRESGALGHIAKELGGYSHRRHYEDAVRRLLLQDKRALQFVRALFEDLMTQLDQSS